MDFHKDRKNYIFLKHKGSFLSIEEDKFIISCSMSCWKNNYVELTVLSKNVPNERIESIGDIQEFPKATPFKLLSIFSVSWAWGVSVPNHEIRKSIHRIYDKFVFDTFIQARASSAAILPP